MAHQASLVIENFPPGLTFNDVNKWLQESGIGNCKPSKGISPSGSTFFAVSFTPSLDFMIPSSILYKGAKVKTLFFPKGLPPSYKGIQTSAIGNAAEALVQVFSPPQTNPLPPSLTGLAGESVTEA